MRSRSISAHYNHVASGYAPADGLGKNCLGSAARPSTTQKYFVRENDCWKIRDEIRALVSFRKMNLLEALSFPVPFDIILCRNVAIYFSEADRARMFGNLARRLARDGSLVIGCTESLGTLCPSLVPRRYLRSVFYQLAN
jgi:chemotaxis protein methyltransferase CheR